MGGTDEAILRTEIGRLSRVAAGRVTLWSDFSVADMCPEPSPLSMSLWHGMTRGEGGIARSHRAVGLRFERPPGCPDLFETICGRCYINQTAFFDALAGPLPLRVDGSRFLVDDANSLDPMDLPLRITWPSWRQLLLVLPTLVRDVLLIPGSWVPLRRRHHHRCKTHLTALRAEAAALREQDLSRLSLSELFAQFRIRADRLTGPIVYDHQLTDLFAFGTWSFLRPVLQSLFSTEAAAMFSDLTTALPGNFNTESNLDLARVAMGAMPKAAFLETYGHRGCPDWDVSAPRWREDPTPVDRMLDALGDGGATAIDRFEQLEAKRATADRRLEEALRSHSLIWPFANLVLEQVAHYRRYSPLRESTQSACYMWVELLRLVVSEIAQRTETDNLLYYMSIEEVETYCTDQAPASLLEVARNRRERIRSLRRVTLPHTIVSTALGELGRTQEKPLPSGNLLQGRAASAGRVRGPARVVTDLSEAAALEEGEILVTARTDPAWTPLFFKAKGLVLEQGSPLSHGAIVARECGLPAVVNVKDATRRIRSGQIIVLDGAKGTVTLSTTE